jgi:hypothetical protein
MFTARELDIMQVEVERQMEKLLEEFVKGFLGNRLGGANGELYDEARGQRIQHSQTVRDNNQPIVRG